MNSEIRPTISLMDQIGPAIDHTKAILLSPFDLNRWLTIGFCAWLANFGESSGSGSNFKQGKQSEEAQEVIKFLTENPVLTGSIAILILLFSVVFVWLSSRGRFMFYHCVLYNQAQVSHPWHFYKHLANNLFRFRLILMLIGFAFAIIAVGVFMAIFGSLSEITNRSSFIGPILMFIPAFVVIGTCFAICEVLTTDFVLPLMHKHTLTCVAAWSKLWSVMSSHKMDLFLYLLFKIVFAIAVGTALLLLGVLTCGCACCLTALPYLGTVLLLPIFTFKRSFSLIYLRQFGPDFDMFATPSTPVDQNFETTEESPNDYCI